MRLAVVAILVLLTGVSHAERTAAVVTYETTTTDAQGVTHTIRFQERIVRDESNVWIVRVLPRAEQRAARAHDLDLAIAARWYRRDGDGVKVSLVSLVNEIVVDVGPESYETFGLVTRWRDVPNPKHLTARQVKREPVERLPWLAITPQFRRLDVSDLRD